MAGSLNHIVDHNTGEFDMDSIENMGDAYEALAECFAIIAFLTGGSQEIINVVCEHLHFPTISHDMRAK